jgi:hypothetical protein
VITDLELEVEYLGGADVDVDYITFQTPNTRALLRDQYRSRVSRQIAETITQLGKELTEDTTLIAKNFTIFGVRSHEEEGELCWYGQRYFNILTNGLMTRLSLRRGRIRSTHYHSGYGMRDQPEDLIRSRLYRF